jgi:hypothetical protein
MKKTRTKAGKTHNTTNIIEKYNISANAKRPFILGWIFERMYKKVDSAWRTMTNRKK